MTLFKEANKIENYNEMAKAFEIKCKPHICERCVHLKECRLWRQVRNTRITACHYFAYWDTEETP